MATVNGTTSVGGNPKSSDETNRPVPSAIAIPIARH
jgi:hypothetical protein